MRAYVHHVQHNTQGGRRWGQHDFHGKLQAIEQPDKQKSRHFSFLWCVCADSVSSCVVCLPPPSILSFFHPDNLSTKPHPLLPRKRVCIYIFSFSPLAFFLDCCTASSAELS